MAGRLLPQALSAPAHARMSPWHWLATAARLSSSPPGQQMVPSQRSPGLPQQLPPCSLPSGLQVLGCAVWHATDRHAMTGQPS